MGRAVVPKGLLPVSYKRRPILACENNGGREWKAGKDGKWKEGPFPWNTRGENWIVWLKVATSINVVLDQLRCTMPREAFPNSAGSWK